MLNSRTRIIERDVATFPLYSSSETDEDTGAWIQPSINRQSIDLEASVIIDGIYVQTRHPQVIPVIEPDLAWELAAWETASDEALMLFEAECE